MPVVPTASNHILGNLYFTTSQAGFMYILAQTFWRRKTFSLPCFFSSSTGFQPSFGRLDWELGSHGVLPPWTDIPFWHPVGLIFHCRCLPDAAQQCRMRHTWSLVGLLEKQHGIIGFKYVCMHIYIIYVYKSQNVQIYTFVISIYWSILLFILIFFSEE